MANYSYFLPILMQNEGYYSNAAGDTGGETWQGVSRNNYPNWPGWAIVDSYKGNVHFPNVLRGDIELSKLVAAFYKPTFWDVIEGDGIVNQSIANMLADWGVNAGSGTPIKHAQEILGVTADGKMGPATLAALNAADGPTFFASLKAARIQFYKDVVMAHPSDRQFMSNWMSRTNSFTYQS